MTDHNRLDQPRGAGRLRRPRINSEAFGEYSEKIARYFGTARYLALQTIIVIAWLVVNTVWGINYHNHHGGKPFDPYPFILLNLAFSTQAAYAAPLILLAQNRQTDRDRIQAEADREEARQSKADLEYLARELASIRLTLGEVATRDFVHSELTRLAEAEARTKEAKEAKKERKRAEVKLDEPGDMKVDG